MHFIMTAAGLSEVLPDIIADPIENSVASIVIRVVTIACTTIAKIAFPIGAECFMIIGLGCLLIACSGSSKWLERGVKSMLLSIMMGMVHYAV